ncbi:MAG: hypothetical protein Crog4KO_25980 [Crocinitomicaceae bacterium]
MTEGLALDIAQEIMRDMGFKRKNYMLRYRHLRIDEGTKLVLKGENHLFILTSIPHGLKVQSKAGVFEFDDTTITEMQHVHRGLTWINNTSTRTLDAKLLQVIPKHKKK